MHAENAHKKVDVVGDVHGCYDELVELVEKLGYVYGQDSLYRHPEGRHLVFVGDLVDRGPKNRQALLFALRHVEAGLATHVQGNHDNKLGRALKGNDVSLGHGLKETLDEFQDMSEDAKLNLSDRLLGQPLYATFDEGRLLVCHAAPPPAGGSKRKTRSTCLYGHTTGRKTEKGFPERLDWVPAYNANADDNTPFVVYGHVTHKEVYLTENACCVDTACFAGNKLSALRWPEREVVSVASRQKWEGEQELVIHTDDVNVTCDVKPRDITTLDLDHLMDLMRDREEEILYLIDTDPLLKKREHENGLVIANASPALFEPAQEHQLFAKGIVYTRDPYRLVSLPLVKMFNHGMREHSDTTTLEVLRHGDVRISFPEKVDGTMIQVFAHEGEVFFTTRSVLEGTESENDPDSFDYIATARAIAQKKYPNLLNANNYEGYVSFVFELIHPESRIVTDYGDREDLVLLSVFDLETFQYRATEGVLRAAKFMGLTHAKVLDAHAASTLSCDVSRTDVGCRLENSLEAIKGHLEAQEHCPEGVIVCFEREDRIVHRVKVKTAPYLKYHRLKFHCTFKNVVAMIWNEMDLHDWGSFLEYIRANGLSEEEVESFYREHFDTFSEWLAEVRDVRDQVMKYLSDFNAKSDVDTQDKRAYYKALALTAKEEVPEIFGLVMTLARSGGLHLYEVMRSFPPYEGFKGEVDKWRRDNEY